MDPPAMVKIYVSLPGGKCLGKFSVRVVNLDSYGLFFSYLMTAVTSQPKSQQYVRHKELLMAFSVCLFLNSTI